MGEEVTGLDRNHRTAFTFAAGLSRPIRLSLDLRKLGIASFALILLQLGLSTLDRLFPGSGRIFPDIVPFYGRAGLPTLELQTVQPILNAVFEPIQLLAAPLVALVQPGGGWAKPLHVLLSVLWVLVIWGLGGGAIARIAMMQVGKGLSYSLGAALRFSTQHAWTLILAPICPLLGIAFLAILGAPFGLLYRVPTVGPVLAGLMLPIPLGLGFVMTILAIGVIAGWPLMVAAAAAGAENALDAWSRAFSYLNQRAGALLASVMLFTFQGIIGLVLVDLFTNLLIHITFWDLGLAVSDGAPTGRFGSEGLGLNGFAGLTHDIWLRVVELGARSWVCSYFWTSAAVIYLWVRRDVDGTEWDQVEPASSELAG